MLTPLSANPKQLTEFFREAGFTHEQFQKNPTLRDLPSRRLGNLPDLLERTSEHTALHVLLRWFFLGVPLESESIAGLVPAPVVAQLLETGMLVRDGGRLTPKVMLTPCEGFLFAADPAGTLESPESSAMVLWPNQSTRLLQMFTIRRPSGATLDLGAGCGILAVLASGHSRQAVATDLNPRATEFARFNVWLNGVANVDFLTGDTFEPVEGCTFDLIMSNPPFFVTPSTGQIYCENSMELDGYCRDLIRAAPRYLNEGGFLQMTLEWVQVRGQAWQDRLNEWLEHTGCDAWVLRSFVRSGAAYAAERIGTMMPYSPLTANQVFDEWMAYYRARGVEEIHGGILVMRRRSGQNWIRIENVNGLECAEPFGEAIVRQPRQACIGPFRGPDDGLEATPAIRCANRPAIASRGRGVEAFLDATQAARHPSQLSSTGSAGGRFPAAMRRHPDLGRPGTGSRGGGEGRSGTGVPAMLRGDAEAGGAPPGAGVRFRTRRTLRQGLVPGMGQKT